MMARRCNPADLFESRMGLIPSELLRDLPSSSSPRLGSLDARLDEVVIVTQGREVPVPVIVAPPDVVHVRGPLLAAPPVLIPMGAAVCVPPQDPSPDLLPVAREALPPIRPFPPRHGRSTTSGGGRNITPADVLA